MAWTPAWIAICVSSESAKPASTSVASTPTAATSRSFARTKAGRSPTSQMTARAIRSELVIPLADQISVPSAMIPAIDVSAPERASSRSTLSCTAVPGRAPSSQSTTSSRAPAGSTASSTAASSATNGTSEKSAR